MSAPRHRLSLSVDEQQDALRLIARLRDCEDDKGEFEQLQADVRRYLRGFDSEPLFYRSGV